MKITYLYSLLLSLLLLAGCQNETDILPSQTSDHREVSFTMNCIDFAETTRAVDETIRRIDLLVFDTNGLFIEKVAATQLNLPNRSFKARIDIHAGIIHFVANYNAIDNFDAVASVNQPETQVIPSLKVNNNELTFWGRTVLSSINSASVDFIRNQAKITVINQYINSNVTLAGFSVCNYSPQGSIAPFVNNSFVPSIDIATDVTTSFINSPNADNLDDKYICEYTNTIANETYVIIKFNSRTTSGGQTTTKPIYYKVYLRNSSNNPYQIVRNVNYRIMIKRIPVKLGAGSFESAMASAPINSIYAEVMKDSPSISDTNGNTLTVNPLVHLYSKATTIQSSITTVGNLGNITCQIMSDPSSILSNLAFTNTQVTAQMRAVDTPAEAKIRVKYGKLERIISAIAAPVYLITGSVTPSVYSAPNTPISYSFNLDSRYPSPELYPDIYPIRCYIKAPNLYPVDNKNMFIDFNYVTGEYWYVYLAQATGNHTINFKTNFATVANDYITIRSSIFKEYTVTLNKTP